MYTSNINNLLDCNIATSEEEINQLVSTVISFFLAEAGFTISLFYMYKTCYIHAQMATCLSAYFNVII